MFVSNNGGHVNIYTGFVYTSFKTVYIRRRFHYMSLNYNLSKDNLPEQRDYMQSYLEKTERLQKRNIVIGCVLWLIATVGCVVGFFLVETHLRPVLPLVGIPVATLLCSLFVSKQFEPEPIFNEYSYLPLGHYDKNDITTKISRPGHFL